MDNFYFEYDDSKRMKTIELFEKDTSNKLCIVNYTIIDNNVCYLLNLECKNKSEHYKPISYIIMRELMNVLETQGAKYIYLAVAAKRSKATFYRLYEHYRSMGFICIPDEFNTNTFKGFENINNSKNFLNDEYALRAKNKNITNEYRRILIDMYEIKCGVMIGSVSHIKTTLDNKIGKA